MDLHVYICDETLQKSAVGSFKIQVSFAEYHLFYRALLQKRLCQVCFYGSACIHMCQDSAKRLYGVATISRLLTIIGLFCRISSLLQGSFAKETLQKSALVLKCSTCIGQEVIEPRNILFPLSLTVAFAFFLSIKFIAALTLNRSTDTRLQHVRSARVTKYRSLLQNIISFIRLFCQSSQLQHRRSITARTIGQRNTPSRVSFAKEPYKRDDILQKRPIFSRSLLLIFAESRHICIHADPQKYTYVRSARVTKYSPPALASSRTCSLSVNCSTYDVRESHTGWRRPICLKLQAIFRKRATNYRALLRKMTYKHKTPYGSSPPFTRIFSFHSFLLSVSFFQSLSKLHGGKARHAGVPRDMTHMCAMTHMRDMTHFYGITRIYDLTHVGALTYGGRARYAGAT